MKVVVLYHPNSDQERPVMDYARDYHMFKGNKDIDLVSLETVEGSDLAKLYDITQYPAVLAISNNGTMLKLWQDALPVMNELDYYMQSD